TPLIARRSIPSINSTTNRARCFSGSHSSTDGGRRNPVWRSIVRKLFIGATFAAMENHRTDSIPNDSYPVKSDRLLDRSVAINGHPHRACQGLVSDPVSVSGLLGHCSLHGDQGSVLNMK